MKVFLTGVSGFIGKEVTKLLLERKFSVLSASRANSHVKISHSNNKIFDQLSDIKADDFDDSEVVIHLAGIAHSPNSSTDDYSVYNTELTVHLAKEAVLAKVKRFIFISTIGVNGVATSGAPFTPQCKENPHNDYAKSKFDAEIALSKIAKDTGLEIVIIRPTLVYGSDAPGNFKLLRNLVNSLPVLPFGAVNNKRSFISIQNLTELIVQCTTHDNADGKVFLATDGVSVSIREFTDAIASSMSKKRLQLPIPLVLMRLLGKFLGKSTMVEQLIGDLDVNPHSSYEAIDWSPPYTMLESMSNLNRDYND
tara:strand:+ start:276 stop:1202 length:927 start_codon:yes stop_codon:yes gene_type:complete